MAKIKIGPGFGSGLTVLFGCVLIFNNQIIKFENHAAKLICKFNA